MHFNIESRSGQAGASRLAVAAFVAFATLVIGSGTMLAGTADAAPTLTGPVGSPAASPSWTIQSTPNPSGSTGNNLTGVSCTSASACTAIGTYFPSSGGVVTLSERWNGTTWTIKTGPGVTSLYGVSCSSASDCIAVGNILTKTRAEQWNGKTWTTQKTPNPAGAGASQLDGVSCTSASACTAVGYYDNTSGYFTLAERWNGTTWTIQKTPNPAGSSQPELQSVSCTSASACTAVGGYENGSGVNQTLAEEWNGTSWKIHRTTDPGPEADYLYGVSCTSASACTGVGFQQLNTGVAVSLAERWNGTSWTTQVTPNPPGPTDIFSGVSCTSASACTAAGSFAESNAEPTGPFAEGWNGAAWTVQTTPSPVGTDDSPLNAVSCTAASACTAVGQYQDSSQTYLTLAERETG